MWSPKRIAFMSSLALVLAAAPLDGPRAMKLQIQRRLDVGSALGDPPPGFTIHGIAHDGDDLWLVHPSGASLVRVDTESGHPLATVPLVGTQAVQAGGLTAGAGSLWLLDTQPPVPVLLRIAPSGQVLGSFPLANLPGNPTGLDFQTGDPGVQQAGAAGDRIRVGYRSSGIPAVEGVRRYRLQGPGIVFDGNEISPLTGAQARSTASFAGASYTWVTAPRVMDDSLRGDTPAETGPTIADEIRVPVPDRSIPRGGEDLASTQVLALIETSRGALVAEIFAGKYPVFDMASNGAQLFLPAIGSSEILVGDYLTFFDVQFGTCVCRDVEFYHQKIFDSARDDVEINFAHPWDNSLCSGPTCPDQEEDGTGGYLAQEVRGVLDPGPAGSHMQSVFRTVGSGRITRHNREIFFGDLGAEGGTVEGWHEIRVNLCEAAYSIMPSLVNSSVAVPAEISDLYTYDGNADGFGDDNPTTDIDDYFTQDSTVVHDGLLASGALSETNLYHKVRAILRYIKRRHVYSGSDGGWGTPEKKLQSPYATCSPSAFMVVALMREAGIPARIVGTTKQRSTTEGDAWRDSSFHRWAQVYMPPYGWVRADATPNSPGAVGFANVNGDIDDDGNPIYDECDLCTSLAQCVTAYGLNLETACGLFDPVNNPNDTDGDGDVDGDDVEMIGSSYYTEAVLDRGSFSGVGTKDLITLVDAGMRVVDGDFFRNQYISLLTYDTGHTTGKTRYVDWRECQFLTDVTLGLIDVAWQTVGPFDPPEKVRIDVYKLLGAPPFQEYVFVRNLALDVPASDGSAPVDLGGLSGQGNHAVVVTRQGRLFEDALTAFSGADWETFGESAPFLVGAAGPPEVSRDMTVQRTGSSASDLFLSWNAAACPATGHHVLFGDAGQFPSTPGGRFGIAGSRCDVGTTSPFLWTGSPDPAVAPSGLVWFLLVADDGANVEGSWGRSSNGVERAGPAAAGSSGACGIVVKDVSSTCGN